LALEEKPMDNAEKEIELENLEDQISTHTKLKDQYQDELKVELEKTKAIMRNIIHSENKIDFLQEKLKGLKATLTSIPKENT
jgi:chromosome segregation ATPase